MKQVELAARRMEAFRGVAPEAQLAEIEALAKRLRGCRVVHLNATAYGGGVAELLQSVVSLQRDLGIDAEWWTIDAPVAFFDATKRLHNALQGMPVELTEAQRALFRATVEGQASLVPHADVIIDHDPQLVALHHFNSSAAKRWIWRCHIDLTTANPSALDFVLPYAREHDAAVFTLAAFVPSDFDRSKVRLIAPAIDPLTEKNLPLTDHQVSEVVTRFGVDRSKPLLVQVARFDPWKDPLGVIDAYRMVRERIPDVQLALVGSLAHDDPEGVEYLERARVHAEGDPRIHILTNLDGVGAREVNAFQRAAHVGIVKSIREGFGLTVSESLWKAVPVVGGNAGGIALQVLDGTDGFLVTSVAECAERCVQLLTDRTVRMELGEAGREIVRERFLTTRLLRDHLALYAELLGR